MKSITVTTRRSIFAAALAAPSLANIRLAKAQTLEKTMPTNRTNGPRGPANRSLAALERSWVVTRFYSDAMMEEGRLKRDLWDLAKLNVIHGNFDIRDPDNGDLLQKVEKGVRVPPPP
jgi:hypothetical protein